MTHEEFREAAEYWSRRDRTSVKMNRAELAAAVENYILSNNTCALATGCGDFVRCTPVEYSYFDGAFWMFSEGGLKFAALEKNRNVCLAIFDRYEGFGKMHGMQVTGKAELVEPFSGEYLRMAAVKKLSPEFLKKMEHPMHLIKVAPERIDYLCSDFKKQNCFVRQTLVFGEELKHNADQEEQCPGACI